MIKIDYCNSTGLTLSGLTGSIVSACSDSGDVTNNVNEVLRHIGLPLTADERAGAIDYLQSTGGWVGEDLNEEDDDTLAGRLLWLVCCDLKEEMHANDIPSRFWHMWDFDLMEWSDKPLTTMNTCYEIWTQDDIDAGEASERGFESQDIPTSAQDIDRLMIDNNIEWSNSTPSRGDWLMASGEPDYRTGETENKSYHFPRDIDADVFDFIVWRSEQ
jgi:hypothetical protein